MKIRIEEVREILSKNNISYDTNLQDGISLGSIKSILAADSESIIFLFDKKFLDLLNKSMAKCCVLKKEHLKFLPSHISYFVVDDPYLVFALLSNYFIQKRVSNGIISKYVNLDQNVVINENVRVDNFTNIYENSIIKNNVIIESNCTIGPNVFISENVLISSN